MALSKLCNVEGGNTASAVRTILTQLLEKGLVGAVMVPLEVPSKNSVVQAVVRTAAEMKYANPLAPVMPVNSAKIVSRLTRQGPGSEKIAIVVRPCEERALVELEKLKQADTENLVVIGIDCHGTYTVTDYAAQSLDQADVTARYLGQVCSGDDPLLRSACRICDCPVPTAADMTIGLIGLEIDKQIGLIGNTSAGEELVRAIGIGADAQPAQREEAVAALLDKRSVKKQEYMAAAKNEVSGLEGMLSVLSSCVACHNCRVACPICYCRECLLDSPTITQWPTDTYLDWSGRKGALRMPNDTLLFHLVRLNHMGASCVACGQCAEACPNGIDVFKLFCLAGTKVQEVFGYRPGKSRDDELPQTAFKETEFKEFED